MPEGTRPTPEHVALLVQAMCASGNSESYVDQLTELHTSYGYDYLDLGVAIPVALKEGTIRHSGPSVLSGLRPVGTYVLCPSDREVYLEISQARSDEGMRPDLLVADQLSSEWREFTEYIDGLDGDWDELEKAAQRFRTLDRIQTLLESEYSGDR